VTESVALRVKIIDKGWKVKRKKKVWKLGSAVTEEGRTVLKRI
jgi:hypothetical protein